MTCPHPAAEPVQVAGIDTATSTVAWICTSCLRTVHPGEVGDRCGDCEWVEEPPRLCDAEPDVVLARPCAAHRQWRP